MHAYDRDKIMTQTYAEDEETLPGTTVVRVTVKNTKSNGPAAKN
jgi:hypothetical protein